MNIKHLKENNETYLSHLKFAGSLGLGFLYRAIFFLIHGFLPMVEIPKHLNLNATHRWLDKAKQHSEKRKT
jgi:hypothetical protein|tara:strand:+ start:254 stop:466 length:213 start_codon:yes stop_codon:yes gene_type:complete